MKHINSLSGGGGTGTKNYHETPTYTSCQKTKKNLPQVFDHQHHEFRPHVHGVR